MKTRIAVFCASVAVLFLSASILPASQIGLDLQVTRYNNSNGSQYYYCYTDVRSESQGFSTLDVYSPDGSTYFHEQSGGSAFGSSNFETIRSVDSGNWSIVLDASLGSQRSYTFNVDLSAINLAVNLPAINITSPADGATVVPLYPTITFTNPGNFTKADINLGGPSGFPYVGILYDPTATSYTPTAPLFIDGTYNFNYQLYTDNAPEVVFGPAVLVDGSPDPLDTFTFQATYGTLGLRTFTEAAPEPATLTLLSLGACFLFRRRS